MVTRSVVVSGLGYVDSTDIPDLKTLAAADYEIEIAGVRYPAEAAARPMYDPGSERIRC